MKATRATSLFRHVMAKAADEAQKEATDIYVHDRTERWLMLALGGLAFLVYWITLSHGVVPGASAASVCQVLNLLPGQPASAPLWLWTTKALAHIPLFETGFRLNLMSAIAGSLAVAWLFRITKRIFFELIREVPSIRMVPSASEDNVPPMTGSSDDTSEHLIATLGGVTAALALTFAAPFWIASTVLHAQTFALLLLLIAVDLVASYHYTGKTAACVVAVFLIGAGSVESEMFILLAPAALGLIFFNSVRYNHVSESFLLLLLVSGLVGLLMNTVLFLLASGNGVALTSEHIQALLVSLGRAQYGAVRHCLPHYKWVYVLAQAVAPAAIALVSIRSFSALQDEVTRWKWGVANLLVTGYALACLMNAPNTAWNI